MSSNICNLKPIKKAKMKIIELENYDKSIRLQVMHKAFMRIQFQYNDYC